MDISLKDKIPIICVDFDKKWTAHPRKDRVYFVYADKFNDTHSYTNLDGMFYTKGRFEILNLSEIEKLVYGVDDTVS